MQLAILRTTRTIFSILLLTFLILSPNSVQSEGNPINVYADIIQSGEVFTWNIRVLDDPGDYFGPELKQGSKLSILVTFDSAVLANGSQSEEQFIFEERVDGKLINKYYTEGLGSDVIDPCEFLKGGADDDCADPLDSYYEYDYIQPIMIDYQNTTTIQVFPEEKIEKTEILDYNLWTSSEIKYLRETKSNESYEKIELFDENKVLLISHQKWYDTETGLLNRKHDVSGYWEIDIIREGYNIKESISIGFISVSGWLMFPILVLMGLNRKLGLIKYR